MPYFAMIHWNNSTLTPVMEAEVIESQNERAQIWETREEAQAAIKKTLIAEVREVTIHDVDGLLEAKQNFLTNDKIHP